MEDLYQFDQEYRDSIATVDEKGKRIWVYPKKPSGRFHNLRIFVSIALLAILFGLPLVKVNGDPLMLIDVFDRKFIILGIHLWPQDFHIVALSMISLVVFVVLFTVVFGRVWCGWACPQTLFMEMVFRRIEYWIDGDRGQQIRLSKLPWNNPEKLRKNILKQGIFWIISFIISQLSTLCLGRARVNRAMPSAFSHLMCFISAMGDSSCIGIVMMEFVFFIARLFSSCHEDTDARRKIK